MSLRECHTHIVNTNMHMELTHIPKDTQQTQQACTDAGPRDTQTHPPTPIQSNTEREREGEGEGKGGCPRPAANASIVLQEWAEMAAYNPTTLHAQRLGHGKHTEGPCPSTAHHRRGETYDMLARPTLAVALRGVRRLSNDVARQSSRIFTTDEQRRQRVGARCTGSSFPLGWALGRQPTGL